MRLSLVTTALSVSLALAAVLPATAAPQGKLTPAKAKTMTGKPKPAAQPAPPAAPAQDQSYLFLSSQPAGRGAPDYVTSGSKHSNQPWFMTTFDRLGNWP